MICDVKTFQFFSPRLSQNIHPWTMALVYLLKNAIESFLFLFKETAKLLSCGIN